MSDSFSNAGSLDPEAGFSNAGQAANDLRAAAGEKAREFAHQASDQAKAIKERAVETVQHFRDVANEVAMKRKKRQKPKKVFLDENDSWTDSYFFPGGFKTRRREMFFNVPADNWTKSAATRSNDEPTRPKKKKKFKKPED